MSFRLRQLYELTTARSVRTFEFPVHNTRIPFLCKKAIHVLRSQRRPEKSFCMEQLDQLNLEALNLEEHHDERVPPLLKRQNTKRRQIHSASGPPDGISSSNNIQGAIASQVIPVDFNRGRRQGGEAPSRSKTEIPPWRQQSNNSKKRTPFNRSERDKTYENTAEEPAEEPTKERKRRGKDYVPPRGERGRVKTNRVRIENIQPTSEYMIQSNEPCVILPAPQRLLLVLDLNGTLLRRRKKLLSFYPRPGLNDFLYYCLSNHAVMIWSSATPQTVEHICKNIFTPGQRRDLVGIWTRREMDLTTEQYHMKVDTYKHLDKIWDGTVPLSTVTSPLAQSEGNNTIANTTEKNTVEAEASIPKLEPRPQAVEGGEWGQHNTILLDDDSVKAAAQPFNCLKVPSFSPKLSGKMSRQQPERNNTAITAAHRPNLDRSSSALKASEKHMETDRHDGIPILQRVRDILEEARRYGDVSAFLRQKDPSVCPGGQNMKDQDSSLWKSRRFHK